MVPMKPVGLEYQTTIQRPRDGEFKAPYAVVQLRQDIAAGNPSTISLVSKPTSNGAKETCFKWFQVLRTLSLSRYGVMHRNSYQLQSSRQTIVQLANFLLLLVKPKRVWKAMLSQRAWLQVLTRLDSSGWKWSYLPRDHSDWKSSSLHHSCGQQTSPTHECQLWHYQGVGRRAYPW